MPSMEIATIKLQSSAPADILEAYYAFSDRYQLVSAKIIDDSGIAQNATNYRNFRIQLADGSATVMQYATQTAQQGTLTAGVAASFVAADMSKSIFEAGAGLRIHSSPAGLGKDCKATIIMKFEKARKY